MNEWMNEWMNGSSVSWMAHPPFYGEMCWMLKRGIRAERTYRYKVFQTIESG